MKKLGTVGVVTFGTVTALVAGGAVMALADWSIPARSGPPASARAASMPVVPVPGARVLLRSVTVSWDAVVMAPSVKMTGYLVTRTSGGSTSKVCQVGEHGPRRCVDLLPGTGTFTYRVRGTFHNWTAPASSGVVVTVPPVGGGVPSVVQEADVAPAASSAVRASAVASASPEAAVRVEASVAPAAEPSSSATPSASASPGPTDPPVAAK